MKVSEWYETEDYELADNIIFLTEGGEDMADEEIDDAEIIKITRNGGLYDVEIEPKYNINKAIDKINNMSDVKFMELLNDSGLENCKVEIKQNVMDLWNEFGDIPMNDNEELEYEWNGFEIGTSKYDIWHWFEESFNVRVIDLLYFED